MNTTAPPAVQFQVQNAQGESVIYVTQDASQNLLTFSMTYAGAAAVTVKGGAPVSEADITPAGPTSLYFTVSTVLTPEEFAAMTVSPPPGWQARLIGSWVLTPIADRLLQPGETISFSLAGIKADNSPGPGSFNIAYYNLPAIADSGTQLPLSLQNLPNLHKRLADSMSASMVGGNAIYVDVDNKHAIPPNTLVLLFDNTTQGPLVPPATPTGTPVFYLTFVSAKAAPGFGALTTPDRLKNITVGTNGDYGTDWNIQDHSDNDPPYWAIYPRSQEVLGVGAAAIAEFRINNIVTDFAPSSTNLYLQWVGVPGYDDGCTTIPLVKRVPRLAIQGLTSLTNNVPSGSTVQLVWTTFNANRATISPIKGEAPPPVQTSGFPVTVARTTTFTLTAYNDPLGTKTSAPVTVDVMPVAVSEPLTATPPTGYHYGDKVALSWAFSSAESCTVDPPINGSASLPTTSPGLVIYPTSAVRYTLTGFGQDGPVTSVLNVVPIPNGWKSQAGAGLWDTRGTPVLLGDFLDRIWFFAGGADDLRSIVFSSPDGFTWSIATNAAEFSPRVNSAGCVLGGKLWLTGGMTLDKGPLNEIWSSADGETWTQSSAAQHWSARSNHGCLAFDGKLWVMGGRDAGGALLNDVWGSPDGLIWTQVTASAAWGSRADFGVAVFAGRLCVVAGRGSGGLFADVWTSVDGLNWDRWGGNVPWPPRSHPGVAAIGQSLFVVGGVGAIGTAFTDSNIASPSGVWTMGLGPNWGPNTLNLASAVFRGAAWFAGGSANGQPNTTVWGFGP